MDNSQISFELFIKSVNTLIQKKLFNLIVDIFLKELVCLLHNELLD